MIKQVEDGQFILDIKQLKEQRIAHSDFLKNKSKSKNNSYATKTLKFLDWYINEYCPTIIKSNKVYNNKHIAQCIYKEKIKSKSEFKEFLLKNLVVSKKYVEYLRSRINNKNISKYEHEISGLIIDLEWLVANLEISYKKSADSIKLTSWRRKGLSPIDIYSAAKTIFFIEEHDNIKDLYLRDLKPIMMFEIRQLLEVYGRNLLGYYEINDNSGNTIKKFTQISWEFIKLESKKHNARISIPFDIDSILLVNNWANRFVHTTFLYNSYTQFFALEILSNLFKSDIEKGIQVYNGKTIKKYDCADVKISNYESLKNDFEKYLKNNYKSLNIYIDWMPIDKVSAYILSI